ncbi:hypothetical protein ABZV58_10215 [Nocardia sp. NPDC004654]|uniref:hypothetical protein n=1 Tax=Nocardia sp. NPDC004654 TaxID=3154776 RepID=UPI0033B22E59
MQPMEAFGVREPLDTRLSVLDPDLEPLFAEVDDILREALAPRPVPVLPKLRTRAPRRPTDLDRDRRAPRLTGRAPPRMRATQRGPPRPTRPIRFISNSESEVMT